jgi:hypothetical protein
MSSSAHAHEEGTCRITREELISSEFRLCLKWDAYLDSFNLVNGRPSRVCYDETIEQVRRAKTDADRSPETVPNSANFCILLLFPQLRDELYGINARRQSSKR